MNDKSHIIIFGEVLFDCFPGGEQVLGGAPFNVAWHLQALGDQPRFVSRIGDDERGRRILDGMREWGMDTSALQEDAEHPTGYVQIEMTNGEPHYTITPGVAYDFIDPEALPVIGGEYILYHGSLAMRNQVSRAAFDRLAEGEHRNIFLDVNLRAPWWTQDEVYAWLAQARWAKMNDQELRALGFSHSDMRDAVQSLQERFSVEQVVITRGKEGVLARTQDGTIHDVPPGELERRVDTVGAGDAFSAVYLHGARAGWPLARTLEAARDFAEKIIGIRGATPSGRSFYREFI